MPPFAAFDIAVVIPGMKVRADSLETGSLGGSESAGVYMARALTAAGARVIVFSNTDDEWRDAAGLRYASVREWPLFANTVPHDVSIVQRSPELFSQQLNSRLNLLWCHDLALGRHAHSFRAALWNIDRCIVVSEYMARQYKEVYGLSDEVLLVSRNGVDLALIDAIRAEGHPRDPDKLMYCARPERGLDVLLKDVMPALLAANPKLRLFIAGYDNHPHEWQEFYAECRGLGAELGEHVVFLGCLSKADLYRHYATARAYLYPTPSPVLPSFREVSCISAIECQAAGLPIVTSSLGALPETIDPHAALFVAGDPSDRQARGDYVRHFIDAAIRIVRDDRVWSTASDLGLRNARRFAWTDVARHWLSEIEDSIRRRNDNPTRLGRHLRRVGDNTPARHLQLPADADPDPNLEGGGSTHAPTSAAQHGVEGRNRAAAAASEDFEATLAADWLAKETTRDTTVLDLRGTSSARAQNLARRFPPSQFETFDFDPVDPEFARLKSNLSETVDLALLRQTLHLAPRPWTLLETVERQVRPGGRLYVTVPFGRAAPGVQEEAACWQFDAHDLRDMMGSKPDFTIEPVRVADDASTGTGAGWWIVSYRADQQPVPEIDLGRHLWLQRPRQTVTAMILAGPACEETLHWMLRSVKPAVDEIVVADCGMGQEARRIAAQYGPRIIDGMDPRLHGFDSARNAVLEACTTDWCLWIDCDERLVGADALEKYLRDNTFDAYAVRQHHFACDQEIAADTPTRLFRREARAGGAPQFFGVIHEHPELALNQGLGSVLGLPDVRIAHVGYLEERTRRERFWRNLPLLARDIERYPDRVVQKFFVMRENMHLVRYALAETQGHVDERMRARCREVIGIFQRHFLGKDAPSKREALDCYSEALLVLGEGFETAFQLEADKSEARPNGVRRCRFASTADLQAELANLARQKATRFDSPWW